MALSRRYRRIRSSSGQDRPEIAGWPRTVALVGIDGSGKTTQAHRLAAALTEAGVSATYWQNASGRRWLGRLARRLGRADGQRLLGRTGMLVAESVLRWLAIAQALIRSAPRRRIAVMDRYAVCQYASTRVQAGRGWERLARLAYRVFPQPDVTFLLAVDPAEAYRRIELRGTDHESLDYLVTADAAYRSLPEFAEFEIIDANRTPDEVSRAIRDRVLGPAPVPAPAPAMLPRPRLRSPLPEATIAAEPGPVAAEPAQARP